MYGNHPSNTHFLGFQIVIDAMSALPSAPIPVMNSDKSMGFG